MKAILYKSDGTTEDATPKNGEYYELKEIQQLVGGYIEILSLRDGRAMIINEDGVQMGLPTNDEATIIACDYFTSNYGVVGDVVVCEKSMIQ